MRKRMKIALDWDDTITLDPPFWQGFVVLAQMNGHEVTIVTARSESHLMEVRAWGDKFKEKLKIIATDGYAKIEYFDADVWIDDSPNSIQGGYREEA